MSKIGRWDKAERIFKALGNASRLRILESIERGISNPGQIARGLRKHRSTIEKHLRVLLAADIIEKVPSLTRGGQLTILYKIRESAQKLLATVRRFFQEL